MARRRKWEDAVTIAITNKMKFYLDTRANSKKCSRYSYVRELIIKDMHEHGINIHKEKALIELERLEAGNENPDVEL